MIETQSSIDEFPHTARRDDAVGPDKRTRKEACYLLLNCSLFGGLRPDERAEVVALARVRAFNAGETVFAIGSPGGPASSKSCVSDCGIPIKCSPKLHCSSLPCDWRRRCCGS